MGQASGTEAVNRLGYTQNIQDMLLERGQVFDNSADRVLTQPVQAGKAGQQAFGTGLSRLHFGIAGDQPGHLFTSPGQFLLGHKFQQGQGLQGDEQQQHQAANACGELQEQGQNWQAAALKAVHAVLDQILIAIVVDGLGQAELVRLSIGDVNTPTGQLASSTRTCLSRYK